jgi:NADPH-dependent 2,4-dienoyl-CoA reductase/sulfur reductase-like enzyme
LLASQVKVGDKGAIVVDAYQRTSVPDVFAVGDCATTIVTDRAEPVYLPHASDALRQGEIAAINLCEPKRAINPSQATFNLNIGERTLCVTGLTLRRALREGLNAGQVEYRNEYVSTEKYYQIWLTYEKGSHRVLGLQMLGNAPDIAPYADIISLAIEQKLTIEDLEFTDFYFKHGYRNPNTFTKIFADLIRAEDPQ